MRYTVASVNRIARIVYLKYQETSPKTWHRKSLAGIQRHQSTVPFRKQLKDETKLRKAQRGLIKRKSPENDSDEDWELTVGLEIHAQLNSGRKLFSSKS